jgi:hypothetical protein
MHVAWPSQRLPRLTMQGVLLLERGIDLLTSLLWLVTQGRLLG